MTRPQFIWSLLVCAVVGVASAQPTFLQGEDPKPTGKAWKQVPLLSDEFAGDTLDRTKWQDDPTASGWPWYGRAPGRKSPVTTVLRMYLDGADTPTIEGNMLDLFNGTGHISPGAR